MSKKTIANIINQARQEGAKHLTISHQKNDLKIDYYFSDGEKRVLSLPHKIVANFLNDLRQVFSIDANELTTKKYCKIAHQKYQVHFYLSILPEANGERVIIDIINRPLQVWRLNQLGLKRPDLQEFRKLLSLRSGLVIISSLPENGKTATLHSLILEINNPSKNIYVLDKNPNYEIPGLNYLEPSPLNWTKIRQHDAEIIFADDLNDEKSLKEAIQTASTGRLVFISTPAASINEILKRILELKLPLRQKLDSLKLISWQHLVHLKRTLNKTKRQEIATFNIFKLKTDLKNELYRSKERDVAKLLRMFKKA